MNKATPIPDSIQRTASGTVETGSCLKCGFGVYRTVSPLVFVWLHTATGRSVCAEKGASR